MFKFGKWAKGKDGLRYKCKLCRSERKSNLRELNRARYIERLSPGCMDCSIKDVRVLVFDHVRGEKTLGVGAMVSQRYSWESISGEMEKCELVCHNCHAIRTLKRGNAWLIDAHRKIQDA